MQALYQYFGSSQVLEIHTQDLVNQVSPDGVLFMDERLALAKSVRYVKPLSAAAFEVLAMQKCF